MKTWVVTSISILAAGSILAAFYIYDQKKGNTVSASDPNISDPKSSDSSSNQQNDLVVEKAVKKNPHLSEDYVRNFNPQSLEEFKQNLIQLKQQGKGNEKLTKQSALRVVNSINKKLSWQTLTAYTINQLLQMWGRFFPEY